MRSIIAVTALLLPFSLAIDYSPFLHHDLPVGVDILKRQSLAAQCASIGEVTCGNNCMPPGSDCCTADGEYCDVGDLCTYPFGCCPYGKKCSGTNTAVQTVGVGAPGASSPTPAPAPPASSAPPANPSSAATSAAAPVPSSPGTAVSSRTSAAASSRPTFGSSGGSSSSSSSTCDAGESICGDYCIPTGYTCCPDKMGGCSIGQTCVSTGTTYGCCPIGKTCSGGGSSILSSATRPSVSGPTSVAVGGGSGSSSSSSSGSGSNAVSAGPVSGSSGRQPGMATAIVAAFAAVGGMVVLRAVL